MLYLSFWTSLLRSYRASRNKYYCQNTKSKSGSKDERWCILLWGFSFLHFILSVLLVESSVHPVGTVVFFLVRELSKKWLVFVPGWLTPGSSTQTWESGVRTSLLDSWLNSSEGCMWVGSWLWKLWSLLAPSPVFENSWVDIDSHICLLLSIGLFSLLLSF